MTTSGTTLFNLTRNQFIEAALRKLGVLAKGDSADSEDLTNGMQAMNAVTAELQTIGLPLWARQEYQFALTASTATYNIGVSQTIATPFPLKIHQAILRNTDTNADLEMEIPAIYDYYRMSPLISSGIPIKLYYQPLVNYGVITVWPTPDTVAAASYEVRLIYTRPIEDFTAAGETMDFPKEWHQAIIYSLAEALAPEYGLPLSDRNAIKREAKEHRDIAESFGSDNSSVYFVPDMDRIK